ncbi:MAG: hypothetical protein Q9160_001664 [Pyrenula sp. 1 TL-2023]
MAPKPRVIYWFRTDLRLHDSPAFKAALDLQPEVLYPIWTWDPHYVYRARVGPNRWQFLIDCQNDVSSSLTKLNKKQKLHVIREAPQTVLPKLFKLWKISHLVFEKDTDAYARERDEEVRKLAEKAGVKVIIKVGRTLYDPDEVVKVNGGPTMSMNAVQKAADQLGEPTKPIPAPKSLPDPGPTDLSSLSPDTPSQTPDFNAPQRTSGKDQSYTSLSGPKKDFAVPTLSELGIPEATSPHRGGESKALKTLESIAKDEKYTATFSKPASAPTDFEPQSTTLLSPHLHFGSLSVREFWWRVHSITESYSKNKKSGPPASSMPTNLPGQLLFREMYFAAQAALGYNFAQESGNKVCRFIDWHLQSTHTVHPKHGNLLNGSYTVDSEDAEIWFRRWKSGTTGFPWIDALMRQLRAEGWIHHLGRHAVACFLTRGGCYVHWERGAEVFEEWLLDHETACNTGNWMWLSCTAFFAQFYRCYSPIAFPKKWDPKGEFVRRYVPELKDFDAKYIYEPAKAPIADQKKWGCLIKGDGGGESEEGELKVYPKPMFDFGERREACIAGMKAAYGIGMYGNDKRVKDGSWREVFEDERDGGGEVKEAAGGELKETGLDGHGDWVGGEEKANGDGEAKGRGKGRGGGKRKADGEADTGKEEEDGEQEATNSPQAKGKKKQGTLDSHVGKKKAKR